MLKECALAFAQTKAREWDCFREEWFAKYRDSIVAVEPLPIMNAVDVEPVEEYEPEIQAEKVVVEKRGRRRTSE